MRLILNVRPRSRCGHLAAFAIAGRLGSAVGQSCNVSDQSEFFLGECPEILLSGQSCYHQCPMSLTVDRPMSCLLGNLTIGTCGCTPGEELVNDTCSRCQPEVACSSCPNHSHVAAPMPGVAPAGGCTCLAGYNREPLDANAPLAYCREPSSCDLNEFLTSMNYTGTDIFLIKEGTCKTHINSGLPHTEQCTLVCDAGRNPQLQTDYFSYIDLQVLCLDGEIVKAPPAGTWCSEEAYLLPPLFFSRDCLRGDSYRELLA